MACFSKDCHWFKAHGDCFYDGVPPSNSPSACEKCRFFKAPTNYDRLRSMTDEELAEFMCHNVSNGTVNCAFCAAAEFCRMGHTGWLDWLRQEVKDEEEG